MTETMARRSKPGSLVVLLIALVICLAAAAIGSALTVPEIPTWYAGLTKPSFNPPNWIFGPVWTILYVLMAIAICRVWTRSRGTERSRAAAIFAVQLVLNVAWSAAFFAGHSPGAGLVVILALLAAIVTTIVIFARIDRLAAWLLAPYLAWVSFASVLNAAIWVLNG